MKKVRITATNFLWGSHKYPQGTVQSFHPHVAEAIIKRGAGVEVNGDLPKVEQKFELAEDEPKPAAPKPRRRYRRRDMQAEK